MTSPCFTQEDVTFMEVCENMLALEADANLRSSSEDVCLFSLRKHKPFGEKSPCRTLKFPWPLTSHRGSQNKDTQEFVPKKKREKKWWAMMFKEERRDEGKAGRRRSGGEEGAAHRKAECGLQEAWKIIKKGLRAAVGHQRDKWEILSNSSTWLSPAASTTTRGNWTTWIQERLVFSSTSVKIPCGYRKMLIIVVFMTPLMGARSSREGCIHGKHETNVFHISALFRNPGEILIMLCGFHFIFNDCVAPMEVPNILVKGVWPVLKQKRKSPPKSVNHG